MSAGLDRDRVAHRLNQADHRGRIVACYTSVLATNAHARFAVNLRLQIIAGGTGTIDRVTATPRNDGLRDCIRAAVEQIEWPNPSGSAATNVDATIDLAPTPPPPHRH